MDNPREDACVRTQAELIQRQTANPRRNWRLFDHAKLEVNLRCCGIKSGRPIRIARTIEI